MRAGAVRLPRGERHGRNRYPRWDLAVLGPSVTRQVFITYQARVEN